MTDPKDALIVGCKALLRQIEAKDALIAQMAAALRDALPKTTTGGLPDRRWIGCDECRRQADGEDPAAIEHDTRCRAVGILTALASDAAQKALAEREAIMAVVEAARCIRHWHDSEPDGMIVSKQKVFELWTALDDLDKRQ